MEIGIGSDFFFYFCGYEGIELFLEFFFVVSLR